MTRNKPTPAASFPTVAEARIALAAWAVTPVARQRLDTGLTFLTRLYGLPAEAIRLDPAQILADLDRASPVAFNIKQVTLQNQRSAVRTVLRRLGLLAAREPSKPSQDADWSALVEALPAVHHPHRLRAFAAFCESAGITPAAVDSGTLGAFLAHRIATRGGPNERENARRVAVQWNKATGTIPGWPQAHLELPPVEGRQLSLPFSAYPAALQQEIGAYLDQMTHSDGTKLFDDNGYRALSPETRDTRRHALRRLLWGGVQSGMAPERFRSLRVMVQPEVIKTVMTWHFERTGRQVNADMGVLSATIGSLARYLRLPDDEFKAVKALIKKATPPRRKEMTAKNVKLLNDLDDPRTQARLLRLPSILMKEAARMRGGWTDRQGVLHLPRPHEAAWLASVAAAIELALHAAIRRRSLTTLRIGEHVRFVETRKGRWTGSIHIPGEEIKNGIGVEVPLTPESTELMRAYIQEFRPLGPNADSDWLFPNRDHADRSRTPAGFAKAIASAIEQRVGLRVNLHAFRAYAGSLVLSANPHAIDDVRAILGHSGFETAMIFYRRSNQQGAARRLSDEIAKRRRRTGLSQTTQQIAIATKFAGRRSR